MDGLLLIDKPPGMTSMDVIRRVRRIAGTKKVGHTGTLDPAATGLLPVAIGRSTKLIQYLLLDSKRYAFRMVLGARTNTDDAEGEVVETGDWSEVEPQQIRDVAAKWVGDVQQTPPAFSAVHIDGKRAYALARKGEEVKLSPRPVRIDAIDFVEFDLPSVTMTMSCGAGTYVRSLARDIGAELGCQGHATDIRRLQVGGFELDEAVTLDALEESGVAAHLLSPVRMVEGLPSVSVTDPQKADVLQGRRVHADIDLEPDSSVALIDLDGTLIAIARLDEDGSLRPKRVFN